MDGMNCIEEARGCLNRAGRRCKDNTSKDLFSLCEMCKNLGDRLS